MAFREVRVFEVREVLRLWLGNEGYRSIERLSEVDRKTARRYVEAAVAVGLAREGGENQLTDVLIGQVVEAVRPHRSDGHGGAWRELASHHDQVKAWVDDGLSAVKIHEFLGRRGIGVPLRTVQRYVAEVCGRTKGQGPTVRVIDGEPGDELQVDFGRLGLLFDAETERNRVVWALLFTACYSRHQFLWLTFGQTTEVVIEGFEAAWVFFGGVFRTVVPDNMAAIVDGADAIEPRLNQAFVEYAQARGFHVDPTRVRHPKDKPRVERAVPSLVRLFHEGQLVKVHPRVAPGKRSTDPADLPSHKTAYAMRDLNLLQRMAAGHGEAIGVYAAALLDGPLPWTKMRQVYALLGLVKKWGPGRVEAACASALDHEVINVGLIGRMLERGTETTPAQPSLPGTVIPARFARDPGHFAVRASDGPQAGDHPRSSEFPDAKTVAALDAGLTGEAR